MESIQECVDDPIEPPPDPLRCFFVGYENPASGWGTTERGPASFGYYVPIFLDFFATGGATNTYSFSEVQTVSNTGTVTYNTGQTVNMSSLPQNRTDQPLVNMVGAGNANASFFDSPGIPMTSSLGTIVSATITWNFTLRATVRNGSETANCPEVHWSVTETWFTVEGNLIASGNATVSTPYTPHP